jgi:hypothetical protein
MPPPRAPGFLVLLLVLAGTAALLLLTAGSAAATGPSGAGAWAAPRAAWQWPVRGAVVQRFSYSRARAFAAGARRGIDVAAAPGAHVGAACGGRVTFAGRVPAGGRGVTVRCGGLVATHLGLGRLAVRRGAVVAPGTRLGKLGAGGRLRLGARRAGDRFAYLDPAALLGDDEPGGGPVAVPLGRAPRPPVARPVPRAPARPTLRMPAHGRIVAARPAPAHVPALAWGGLVVLAAGLPLGGLVRRDRRRRVRRERDAVAAAAGPGWSRL